MFALVIAFVALALAIVASAILDPRPPGGEALSRRHGGTRCAQLTLC
jgi:hypothetical protein